MIKKIRSKLSLKIFLYTLTIISLISVSMYVGLWISMPQTYQNNISQKALSEINELAETLSNTPMEQWEESVTLFSNSNTGIINIYDENNEKILGVGSVVSFDEESNTEGQYETILEDFVNDGKQYKISMDVDMIMVDKLTEIFMEILPYIIVVIIIVSIIVAYIYARFISKPIEKMSLASKKMTDLDLQWVCDIKRDDEIGVLSSNLNIMANKLEIALDELQSANQQLELDIEKERQQEQRRKDFFIAISHELKTPLTIIKGELEGMIYNVGKFKDRDLYLQKVFQKAESMEELIKEILNLTKIETIDLELEDINITTTMQEVYDTYMPLALEKNISLIKKIENDVEIVADQKQMMTVVSNIIGNAIKHSPNNAIVEVILKEVNDKKIIQVKNNNVEINQKDMNQLFMPFYKVDKSRNSNGQGNGFGLYIVKVILDLHDFKYTLENIEDSVIFTITI
ncbi:MAG: ATP-binding protein [Coprobacillaceae bacterium]